MGWRKCSYIDFLQSTEKKRARKALTRTYSDSSSSDPYYAPSTVYVCHAWDAPFADLVDALEQHEREHPDSYFWVDLFAANQYVDERRDTDWFRIALRDRIRMCGSFLLVVTPWEAPLLLTRTWCQWELFCALTESAVALCARLPKQQVERMALEFTGKPYLFLESVRSCLRDKAAKARNQRDKGSVIALVHETVGFPALYQTIEDALRAWHIDTLRELAIAKYGVQSPQNVQLLVTIGSLLAELGVLDAAVEIHNKALDIAKSVHGPQHIETAGCLSCVADSFYRQSNFKKSEENYQLALRIRINVLGKNHKETAITYSNLGAVFFKSRYFARAVDNIDQAILIQLQVLGPDHPDLATSYHNLGGAYDGKGQFIKSIEAYEKCLDIRRRVLGASHPNTGVTLSCIAYAYYNRGTYDKAIEFFEQALGVEVTLNGPANISLVPIYNSIGTAYKARANYDKAIYYFEKALEIRTNTLGYRHQETGNSFALLGEAHRLKGAKQIARDSLTKALEIFMETLGPNHASTRAARDDLRAIR